MRRAFAAPDGTDHGKNIGPFACGQLMGVRDGAAGGDDILDKCHAFALHVLAFDGAAGAIGLGLFADKGGGQAGVERIALVCAVWFTPRADCTVGKRSKHDRASGLADNMELAANAIVNVRFATSAVAQGAAELFAYGTAVRVE